MKILLSALVALLFIGCRKEHKETHESHASGEKIEVRLDDGKKWKANIETTQGIQRMADLVKGVASEASGEDYKKLGVDLEAAYQEVFKKCTMKGAAHDNLHAYLAGLVGPIRLLKTGDVEKAHHAVTTMAAHLKEYPEYFE